MRRLGFMASATMALGVMGIASPYSFAQGKLHRTDRSTIVARDDTAQNPQQTAVVHKASKLIGKAVKNEKGEDLGKVHEFVIDDQGRAVYAALSVGGVLGIGDKLFAVPWEALRLEDNGRHFVMKAEKKEFDAAFAFDPKHWPASGDPRWLKGERVARAYAPTNGEQASEPLAPADTAVETAARDDWESNGSYNKMFDPMSVDTIRGEVTKVEIFTPSDGMSEGLQILLDTDEGMLVVHLGPRSFVGNQDIDIRPGDRVEVTGSEVMFNGKKVWIATEVRMGDELLKLRDRDGSPLWSGDAQERTPTSRGDERGRDTRQERIDRFDRE